MGGHAYKAFDSVFKGVIVRKSDRGLSPVMVCSESSILIRATFMVGGAFCADLVLIVTRLHLP